VLCSSPCCKRSLVVVIVLSCVWHLEGAVVIKKGLDNQIISVCPENSFFLRPPAAPPPHPSFVPISVAQNRSGPVSFTYPGTDAAH
jgi:hypothetical protein